MTDIVSYYWSRIPGKFVNKNCGKEISFKYHNISTIEGDLLEEAWKESLIYSIQDIIKQIGKPKNYKDVKVIVGSKIFNFLNPKPVNTTQYDGEFKNEFVVINNKNQTNEIIKIRVGKKSGKINVLDI